MHRVLVDELYKLGAYDAPVSECTASDNVSADIRECINQVERILERRLAQETLKVMRLLLRPLARTIALAVGPALLVSGAGLLACRRLTGGTLTVRTLPLSCFIVAVGVGVGSRGFVRWVGTGGGGDKTCTYRPGVFLNGSGELGSRMRSILERAAFLRCSGRGAGESESGREVSVDDAGGNVAGQSMYSAPAWCLSGDWSTGRNSVI
jgi:hypothetical protein